MAKTPELYRPHYHLTPTKGWMNDPNGLCFFRGRWHVFFQHYDPAVVDSMQWAHAVSEDLSRWRRLPDAIGPDQLGQPWSGSAVVDHHDTSKLFDGKPGIVCLFTYWDKSDGRQCQGMAFSPDGLTFHKHPANPVIPQLRFLDGLGDDKDFRDPKVFWHAESGRWIMAVAGGKLRIFSSADLINWRFESIDDSLVTECPDLFPMHLDGDPARQTWVLSGGGRWYMLGDFDGRRFTPRSERIAFTHAPDFYAGQTFDNAPAGRRVMISWLHSWQYGAKLSPAGITHHMPTDPWSGGCLTVPYELSLRSTPAGPRLMILPAAELTSLRLLLLELHNQPIAPANASLARIVESSLDVELRIAYTPGSTVGLHISAGQDFSYAIGYDSGTSNLFVDRRRSGRQSIPTFCELLATPLPPRPDHTLSLRILLDRNCVEIFSAAGSAFCPAMIFPDPDRAGVQLFSSAGDCRVEHLAAFQIPSAIA